MDEYLLDDDSCPRCGSLNIVVLMSEPPVKCNDCGWRGHTREATD